MTAMPGLGPGIHVFSRQTRRGWPGQARPWRVLPDRKLL